MNIKLSKTQNGIIVGPTTLFSFRGPEFNNTEFIEELKSGKYNSVRLFFYDDEEKRTDDIVSFITLLQKNKHITNLHLPSRLSEDDGCRVVAALSNLHHIDTVNLSGNYFGCNVDRVVAGFSLMPQLQTLILAGNDFGGYAVNVVIALSKCKTLRNLNLSFNHLREYVFEIAEMLFDIPQLQTLNLTGNDFDFAAGDILASSKMLHIAQALARCKTVHSIEFGGGNSNKLEKVFIKAVIDRGDVDHIASVMEHNPYVSLEHVNKVFALYGIGEGDHSLDAGAGSSLEGDELWFMPQKLKYNFKLHDALIVASERLGLTSNSERLRQMEQDTLKSILEGGGDSHSVLPLDDDNTITHLYLRNLDKLVDDDNAITHLYLRNLDKLAQSSNYTKSIFPEMPRGLVDARFVLVSNFISSLSILDTISAQLLFGDKIIPLIRNSSDTEGLDVTEANIGATEEFYRSTKIEKKTGSIFASCGILVPILQIELSKNPQLEKVFSDALAFIIGHRELLDIVSMVDSDSGPAGAGRGAREDEEVLDEAEADPYADMPVLEYVGDVELGGDAPSA